MLSARHLHIKNILEFFIFYVAAEFCIASILMKDFTEAVQKDGNSGCFRSWSMRVSPVLEIYAY